MKMESDKSLGVRKLGHIDLDEVVNIINANLHPRRIELDDFIRIQFLFVSGFQKRTSPFVNQPTGLLLWVIQSILHLLAPMVLCSVHWLT